MRLRRLEPVLRRAFRGPCALAAGSTLLLAVSGGADSTALVVAMVSLARELGIRVQAAHLHHGLRGADADADLRSVRELCERLHVPLTDARWSCAARMRQRGLGGEAGLRTLRREFLLRAMRATGAAAIATAHTADDQLETLLLRFARGTSLTGAAGMRPRQGPWLKPMLFATRADIEHDLARAGFAWREDRSNASGAFARNRVRHTVVPALLEAACGAPRGGSAAQRRAPLARRAAALARDLAAADCSIRRLAALALERMAGENGFAAALPIASLRKLPVAVRMAVLRLAWKTSRPAGRVGLTSRHVEMLLRAILSRRTRSEIALPAGRVAVVERGSLRVNGSAPARRPAGEALRRAGPPDARLNRRQATAASLGAAAHSRPRPASREVRS